MRCDWSSRATPTACRPCWIKPNAAKGHDDTFNDDGAARRRRRDAARVCASAPQRQAPERERRRRTPLHQVDANCPRVLIDIWSRGGDVKATDARGWTPPPRAAAAAWPSTCAAPLTNGADAAAKAKDGLTALDIATAGDPDDVDDLNFADLGLDDADGEDLGRCRGGTTFWSRCWSRRAPARRASSSG